MIQTSIVAALRFLGYEQGFATLGDEITIWEHDDPKPTLEDLIAAGYVPLAETEQELPVEALAEETAD